MATPAQDPRQETPGAGAVAASTAPLAVASITPALASAGAVALTGVALTRAIDGLVQTFMALAQRRFTEGADFVYEELQKAYPARPKRELMKLVDQERIFEREFRRKMRARLERDLPEILSDPDAEARLRNLQAIFDREKRYTVAREEAMFLRALGKAEAATLKEISPKGAYWKLSPFVQQHTLDCLAMGEKFWPWEVLDDFQPPVHHGCACHLISEDEATRDGLMTPDQIPDTGDAVRRYRQAMQDVQDMEESLTEAEIRDWIEGTVIEESENVIPLVLEEGKHDTGAMVALYPPKPLARKLAVDGGEPVDELHLTLGYLGKAADLSDHKRIEAAVRGFAATCPPLEGEISGGGLFTAGPDPVTYASVDLPELPAQRQRLVDHLDGAGAPVAKNHGYTPHITLAYDKRDLDVKAQPIKFDRIALVLGPKKIEFPLQGHKHLEEAEVARWGKGFEKGGQFRPKRGGSPGALLRRLFPHPKPPAALRGERRGRWSWINGTYTRIPEADHWERTSGGHHYVSPAGGTNVYRDGKLIDGLGMASDEKRARPGRRPATNASIEKSADAIREEIRQQALELGGIHPPVRKGDGPSALLALRDHGFVPTRLSAGTSTEPATLHLRNDATKSQVTVGFDGKQITDVNWTPVPEPPPAGHELGAAPQSWDEFRSDAFAWAHELGSRYGSAPALPDIRIDSSLADHAGTHLWSGDTYLGRDVTTDIERAGKKRAAGVPLSEDERRGVWSSYWVAAHEIGHAVNPIEPWLYQHSTHANLEEALTEEMAHVLATERLTEQGQKDVLDWRSANPDSLPVKGVYLRERGQLSKLLDEAGLHDLMARRNFVAKLKFQTDPVDRFAALASAIKATGDSRPEAELLAHVEDAMEYPKAAHAAALPFIDQSPGERQLGRLGYGRFAGAKISHNGTQLDLPDGSHRRVEKLPVAWPAELEGMTDGSAVVVYPPGYETTNGLTYADGTPKNFRYVDTQERGKLILRAFTGKGSPGFAVKTLAPGQRFTYGGATMEVIGHSGGNSVNARVVVPDSDPDTGGAQFPLGQVVVLNEDEEVTPEGGMASPGIGDWFKKLTHTGQGNLFDDFEQGALDDAFAKTETKNAPKPKPDPLIGKSLPADPDAPPPEGAIPNYDATELTWGKAAGGSNGARFAMGSDGHRWLVKTYRGDRDRIATELLANAVYREMGAPAAVAGTKNVGISEPDFRQIPDVDINEPPLPKPEKGKKVSTGMVVMEPDGRIWVYEPKGHYGGYEHTFPKGRVEPGYTGQQNAHKELLEETGLHAQVVGLVGDFKGDVTTTRYYLAVRTGGDAAPTDDETQAVKLLSPDEAMQALNRDRDKKVLGAALAMKGQIPKVAPDDTFPYGDQKIALVYPTLDGETRHFEPSEELGKHYMTDALLANWDFVGMTMDNVLWDGDKPIRLDQGGTFELRAQGSPKPYGPIPTEVWTMLSKGQGKRGVKVTEDSMREQAADIVKTLTPARVDDLVDTAPFKDNAMRERIRENLKARIDWMDAFAKGEVEMPKPAENDAAHDALFDAQEFMELYPEQEDALYGYFEGMNTEVDAALKDPKAEKSKYVKKTISELDSLMRHAQTKDDVIAWAPLNLGGKPGEDLDGKNLQERGFMSLDIGRPEGDAVLRLVVPEGSHAVYTHLFDELPADAPDLLIARDARVKVDRVYEENGQTVVSGTLATQKPYKPYKPVAPKAASTWNGGKPKAAGDWKLIAKHGKTELWRNGDFAIEAAPDGKWDVYVGHKHVATADTFEEAQSLAK